MEEVINLGIPHVGEHIFESLDTPELIKFLEVSTTWKVLAENVLLKKWKGKIFEACKKGESKVVQLLLERCKSEDLHKSGNNRDVEMLADGWTPFMRACNYGSKDVVKVLLDHPKSNNNWRLLVCTWDRGVNI